MNDFIYCQRDIPKDQWRYGLRSSAATGCGWIACYNALKLMGYKAKPERLIKYFEKQLPLLNGNTGTFVLGPAMFFRKFGFKATKTPFSYSISTSPQISGKAENLVLKPPQLPTAKNLMKLQNSLMPALYISGGKTNIK